jgi:hypothetical protein
MWSLLKTKLVEVLKAVSPLIVAACVLQLAVVDAPLALFWQFLAGSTLAIVGMVILFIGIDLGILPMGKYIGAELPQKGSLLLIVMAAMGIGFATTFAEPDVLVLGDQVDEASAGALSRHFVIYAIAIGVALMTALAMVRIVTGWSMKVLLAGSYALAIVLALAAPAELVPLAFDGGSVTTGVLSAPAIMAVAIGLSSVLAGRSALTDGFGLVGFASVGPILTILLVGLLR